MTFRTMNDVFIKSSMILGGIDRLNANKPFLPAGVFRKGGTVSGQSQPLNIEMERKTFTESMEFAITAVLNH